MAALQCPVSWCCLRGQTLWTRYVHANSSPAGWHPQCITGRMVSCRHHEFALQMSELKVDGLCLVMNSFWNDISVNSHFHIIDDVNLRPPGLCHRLVSASHTLFSPHDYLTLFTTTDWRWIRFRRPWSVSSGTSGILWAVIFTTSPHWWNHERVWRIWTLKPWSLFGASGFRDRLPVLQSPPSSVRFYGGGLQHEGGRLFGARIRHVAGTQGDISSGVGRDLMTSARSGIRDKSRIRIRIGMSWCCRRSERLDRVWE